MPIKKVSFRQISLNLHEDNRSKVFLLLGYDFSLQSLDTSIDYPIVNMIGSIHKLAPSCCLPFLRRVEALAHVVDADVFLQGGKSGFGELFLNEILAGC
jgi:hypothetical protein